MSSPTAVGSNTTSTSTARPAGPAAGAATTAGHVNAPPAALRKDALNSAFSGAQCRKRSTWGGVRRVGLG